MKIFHTSDWHIGRSFHTHSTLEHFRIVVDGMARMVSDEGVDVVVVAGDIFDSAMPAAEAYSVLGDTIRALRSAGARILLTSGNHDSGTRLGFQSEWAQLAGVHVLTRHETLETPVSIDDEHGPVHFYGIPYLEPAIIRHHHPDVPLRTHEQALDFAMTRIRADIASRSGRSVVISHCFAAGVAAATGGLERDITAGGLDLVPASVFSDPASDGPDYVALGHLHGRSKITDRVRYSGAPLYYSFSESGRARGGWMVTLDASGLASVGWIDLPIPRPVSEITGTVEQLLTSAEFIPVEDHWIKARLTDQGRPLDAMRRLQTRFANCVNVVFEPVVAEIALVTYGERIKEQTDLQIVAGFVEYVRNGAGPTQFETRIVAELLAVDGAIA